MCRIMRHTQNIQILRANIQFNQTFVHKLFDFN